MIFYKLQLIEIDDNNNKRPIEGCMIPAPVTGNLEKDSVNLAETMETMAKLHQVSFKENRKGSLTKATKKELADILTRWDHASQELCVYTSHDDRSILIKLMDQ